MFNTKKINFNKNQLKFLHHRDRNVYFTRKQKNSLFSINKEFILHGGNRFFKKKMYIFDLNYAQGLYCLTRKPFGKPINRSKLKL